MLIHIGEGCLVRDRSIIGCFDMDGSEMSDETVEFLRKAEKEGIVDMLTTDIPRSMVLTDEKVYVTRISTGAIKNRAIKQDFER